MKNKIRLCIFIIIITAFSMLLGFTNSRYNYKAKMTGDIDLTKIVGVIEAYQPETIDGYDTEEEYFKIFKIPTTYTNIHYKVSNQKDNNVNDESFNYYIKIVAEDGSDNMPIEYDVHKYGDSSYVYPYEEDLGYGPFTLKANLPEETYYDIKIDYTSRDQEYASNIQHLRVQMIKKEENGNLKVIDEAPLNIRYITVEISIVYYVIDGKNTCLGGQTMKYEVGITINFKDTEQLNLLDIKIPEGYEYVSALSAITDWQVSDVITVPSEGDWYRIEVYLVKCDTRKVTFEFYDVSSNNKLIGIHTVYSIIKMGTEIDFTNPEQLQELNVQVPEGYEAFEAWNKDRSKESDCTTKVTIPEDISSGTTVYIGVHVRKANTTNNVENGESILLDKEEINIENKKEAIDSYENEKLEIKDSVK